MIRLARGLFMPAAILVLIALAFPASAGQSAKTITRTADPLIVKGGKLQALIGVPLANITLYADSGGSIEPIPFQIDQRNSMGRLVLPDGPESNIDDEPNFDKNDELIFMAKDCGRQVAVDSLPAKALVVVEIALSDPAGGGQGWVYAASFEGDAPRSKKDYVRFDPKSNMIYAGNYTMGFSKKAPIAIGHLSYTKAGGGDDVNHVDRLKIRFSAKAMGGMVDIEKDEDGFTSLVIAWTDGPVRVVRRTRNRQTLFWKIPSPSAYLDNIYYESIFEFPTKVNLPFDVDTFLDDPKFRVSTDSLCSARGRIFFNEKNPDPVSIDGVMSDAEKNLDKSPYKWMVVAQTGTNKGGWMNRLIYDKDATPAVPKLYYVDDMKSDDSPEEEKGQCGDVGYTLENLVKVKKGTLNLTSVMYNIPDFNKSKISAYLNILDKPIRVKTRQLK